MMPNKNNQLTEVKLCSINICGFGTRSKFMVNKYNDMESFDVLAIQELGATNRDKLNLENMSAIADTNNSVNRGVALYTKNSHSLTQIKSISNLSKNSDSTWGLIIMNNKRYIVGNIYVKLNYSGAIKETLEMLNFAHQKVNKLKAAGVVLMGDFNARHISWGDTTNNSYGRELVDKIDNSKFTITTSKSPTFLSANGSSHIDLMIVSNNLSDKLKSPYTDDTVELFSGAPRRGHVPLLCNFAHKTSAAKPEITEKLCIDSMNWIEWSRDIEEDIVRNQQILNAENYPHQLWEYLDKVITKATEDHAVTKKTTKHSKPYWTNHLTTLSKNLREARKAYNQRNTDPTLKKLNSARDAFDEERKRECEDFLLKRTSNLNSVQAMKFWKEFNKIFKKKTESKIDPLDDNNGGLLSENQELEEVLFSTFFEGHHLNHEDFDNEFFNTVIALYEEIATADATGNNNDETTIQADLNSDITVQEILNCIKNTKYSGKSFDNEHFHPVMFKHLGNHAIALLHKLFNLCLQNSQWVWDSAQVIFLKKAGKDTYSKPGSYRPISISAYIGKLMEKIIAVRLETYLQQKNLYDPDQEGFSKGKNTVRYLNRLHLKIKADIAKKKTILCIFIDLEKAFDSIWKKGLIAKLFKLGITGYILRLIDHFLSSRKVNLNINGSTGNYRQTLDVGLPQGSVLSPILFRIYLMDLLHDLTNTDGIALLKFADDGTIIISSDSTEDCLRKTNHVLDEIHMWVTKWRLNINCQVNKTEIICFASAENNRNNIPKTFKIGNDVIHLVSQTKVLGIIIDENLSYKAHSDEVYKNLNATWADICKYSNRNWGFNQRTMVQLIKTLFIPKLMYAGHVWINKNNLQNIKSLWYKILKATVGATFNISAALAEVILGLPPIDIQVQINRIKHLLKLNIAEIKEDRLKEFILDTYDHSSKTPVTIHTQFKQLYQFLNWKLQEQPSKFTEQDIEIITNLRYDKYFDLTPKSCGYTQALMKNYTEILWNKVLKNQFQLEGYQEAPVAKCTNIPIPAGTPRSDEVHLFSLMYKNNVMQNFMYSIGKAESPMCPKCLMEEHTPSHILLRCASITQELRQHISVHFNNQQVIDEVDILNASRSEAFIRCCLRIVREAELPKDIDLNVTYT